MKHQLHISFSFECEWTCSSQECYKNSKSQPGSGADICQGVRVNIRRRNSTFPWIDLSFPLDIFRHPLFLNVSCLHENVEKSSRRYVWPPPIWFWPFFQVLQPLLLASCDYEGEYRETEKRKFLVSFLFLHKKNGSFYFRRKTPQKRVVSHVLDLTLQQKKIKCEFWSFRIWIRRTRPSDNQDVFFPVFKKSRVLLLFCVHPYSQFIVFEFRFDFDKWICFVLLLSGDRDEEERKREEERNKKEWKSITILLICFFFFFCLTLFTLSFVLNISFCLLLSTI